MQNAKRFDLRAGERTWAALFVTDGEAVIEHDLSETEVARCPGVLPHAANGEALKVMVGEKVVLSGQGGAIVVNLKFDIDRDLVDARDPQGKVTLTLQSTGPGSAGNAPVKEGGFVLGLRWIGN